MSLGNDSLSNSETIESSDVVISEALTRFCSSEYELQTAILPPFKKNQFTVEDYITKKEKVVEINVHKGIDKYPYNPHSDIFNDRLNCIYDAFVNLVQTRIKEQHQAGLLSSLEVLKLNVNKELEGLKPKNESEHQIAVVIIEKTTLTLAKKLKEAEKEEQTTQRAKEKSEKDWLRTLQKEDYKLISSKQRNIVVNVYPDGYGGFVISHAEPITNLSSLSRHGEPPVLPNFWRTNSLHYNKNGKLLSQRTNYRSSSIAPFEEKNREKRLKKAEEIAKFEMRQYAYDRVKNLLKNHPNPSELTEQDIKNAIKFDYFNMSLQSTIIGEETPVKEASLTYEKIQEAKITFTSQQQSDINEMLRQLGADITISDHDEIKPNIIYMNLGTNMVRGDDRKNVQSKINLQAKRKLQIKLISTLEEYNDPELSEIIDLLNTKCPITKEALKNYNKQIKDLEQTTSNYPALEVLLQFSEFAKYNIGKQKSAFRSHLTNESKENYYRQETALVLAESLGCIRKINCQSGKDRTGVQCASAETAQVIRDYRFDLTPKRFWSLLHNSVNYTTGREITTINCPGAKGIQGQNYPFISPAGFRKRINATVQDRASRLHKAPYLKDRLKQTINKLDVLKKSKTKKRANRLDDERVEFKNISYIIFSYYDQLPKILKKDRNPTNKLKMLENVNNEIIDLIENADLFSFEKKHALELNSENYKLFKSKLLEMARYTRAQKENKEPFIPERKLDYVDVYSLQHTNLSKKEILGQHRSPGFKKYGEMEYINKIYEYIKTDFHKKNNLQIKNINVESDPRIRTKFSNIDIELKPLKTEQIDPVKIKIESVKGDAKFYVSKSRDSNDVQKQAILTACKLAIMNADKDSEIKISKRLSKERRELIHECFTEAITEILESKKSNVKYIPMIIDPTIEDKENLKYINKKIIAQKKAGG